MATTQTLIDHDAIREWATARGASPARMRGGARTELTFDFHDDHRAIDDLKWDRWFEAFDRFGLALLVDSNSRAMSRRFDLVPRAEGRTRTGAARRRRDAPGGNQPVGVQSHARTEQSAEDARPARQSLRKIVKAQSRRPALPPATGTPGPARRVKSRALPKPIRAPRTPKAR